jgi:hypothetical protein
MICIPQYYITGDGPSHVYNAQVVSDYISNHHRDFYKEFYQLNRSINANLVSTIYLSGLLKLFPFWLADKLMQVTCLLLFAFGFRYTLKKIAPENLFLSILWFPLTLTILFQMGFYHFVLAMGLLCWFMGFMISHIHKLHQASKLLIASLLLLTIALTHPLVAMFGLLLLGVIIAEQILNIANDKIIKQSLFNAALIIVLPTSIILCSYILTQGFEASQSISIAEKCKALFSHALFSSIAFKEDIISTVLTILLFILFSYYSFIAITTHNKKSYIWLLLALLFYCLYFIAPNSIGIGGSILPRILLMYFIVIIFFIAQQKISSVMASIITVVVMCCIVSYAFIRIPRIMQANTLAKSILQASSYIKEKSIVHTFHINDHGKNSDGNTIFELDNSFIHVSDYVGAIKNKPILLTNNYEAEYNCFVVQWRTGKNPRNTIPYALAGVYPPFGTIPLLELQWNKKIDYLLFQNSNETYFKDTNVIKMMTDVNTMYKKVFANKDVLLYQRNQ